MAYGQLFLLAQCIRLRIHVGIKWLGLIRFLNKCLSGHNFPFIFHKLFVTYDKNLPISSFEPLTVIRLFWLFSSCS